MAETPETRAPVNVLVVDDREENRRALRAILSSSAYRIVEAASGAEALRRLLLDDFAVLLVDVAMPDMDGFELATAIKARARSASIPIVFLTAFEADRELVAKGYRVGAVDYLVKPVVPEIVRAKVEVLAELYRQRKRIEEQGRLLLDSERRDSELRLTELRLSSERRYRNLAEAVPHVVWSARPDGLVDYFNHRWFELTGISAAQAGGSFGGALHPDDVDRVRAAWEAARGSGRRLEVECRLRNVADGTFHWHLLRAVPELGSTGTVVSWLGTFTDIEDQKRAQEVLAEFKGTLDAVLDAVLIFDADGWRFVYVNRGAAVLSGFDAEELAKMGPLDLLAEYDEQRLRELLAPLHEGSERAITIEARFRRRQANAVPIEISFQLVGLDGGRHVVSIARDITARKLGELEKEQLYREAVAAIGLRDEFLSIASHELKTPLASLQLQLELLGRAARAGAAPSVEELRSKLDVATRQVERLSRLIAELMDVSRIAAGRLHLELEEVDLAGVAEDVAARFRDDAQKAGCQVSVRVEARVVGRWDRLRMEQVATNLLANALKFGAKKPIEVTIGEHDGHARLVVRDHGIGISKEDADRIFRRFERARTVKKYPGMGLGLYIVRQIVEAHGGTIHVESSPGEGAAFVVDLPFEPRPESGLEAGATTH